MLLTMKLWLTSCHLLAPPRKMPWQEEPISMKKKPFPSPLAIQLEAKN